jgi:hypothetical protein
MKNALGCCLNCGKPLDEGKFCRPQLGQHMTCERSFLATAIRHAEIALKSGRLSITDLRRSAIQAPSR